MIRTKTHRRGRPITREQRALIREQARQGKSGKEIEAYMSCSKKTVRRAIINNFKPKDNLAEDADYLLGRKGGLVFIDDDAMTPEPQGNTVQMKEEYEDPDILSMSDWSPTPIDPNDLPYVNNVHEEAGQAEDSADKDRPPVLRQSARLKGLKVQDHVLPADRECYRSANSEESVADAIDGDITSRSNDKRTRRSNERAVGDSETEEYPEPSTSRPSQSGHTRKPSKKAKAVILDLVEMRRTIQRGALGIPAKPAVASTSRSTGAVSSSSSSTSRTAVAPALASHNLNNENAPIPAMGQTQIPNNKTLSRDAAIKILRDLAVDERHADIVIATGIKTAEHLKGMVDLPEKLLRLIKTDVIEQGFDNWDYVQLLAALCRRPNSGWRET